MVENEEFLVITKKQVKNLRENLKDSTKIDEVEDELEKMLGIKRALLWRSEIGGCCSVQVISEQISWEVQTIEDAINALQDGNVGKVASLLEDYEKYSLIPDTEGDEVLCRF